MSSGTSGLAPPMVGGSTFTELVGGTRDRGFLPYTRDSEENKNVPCCIGATAATVLAVSLEV